MIPTAHKQQVMSAGLHFIRTITEAYGAEDGMALWTRIADVLDPDVKGEMFMAMITGAYNDRITVSDKHVGSNKVAIIKAIRTVDRRRLGLKEAKDLSDMLDMGKQIVIEVEPSSRASAMRELAASGLVI